MEGERITGFTVKGHSGSAQAGADLVLDSANNPTLLYTNPSVERTQQVIDALKK